VKTTAAKTMQSFLFRGIFPLSLMDKLSYSDAKALMSNKEHFFDPWQLYLQFC